ncbi:hypothetical protein PFISCL1PPCAC_9786, partial [Pristionchus fissidentatus]
RGVTMAELTNGHAAVHGGGHEFTITKIENTLESMAEMGLQNDPRYLKTEQLKAKLMDGPLPSAPAHSPLPPSTQFEAAQIAQLKAQVAVYKLLARNQSIPAELASVAMPTRATPTTLLPEPYEIGGETDDGDSLPYDLTKVLSLHHQRVARSTHVNVPPGIDPASIMKERENRIANRIGLRIQALNDLPADMPDHLRIRAEIELRALRLVNFQAQIRNDVMGALKRDTTLMTSINPHAYRHVKRQSLREARVTDNLEKQRKTEAERRKRKEHEGRLVAIMQHAKNFKEFHRTNAATTMKARKAVVAWHQNSDRERQREEARKERERMQKLMVEDEEGYRQMLDEKKDKRLVYLLEQTDEFINSLTGLVKAHQATEQKKKEDQRKLQQSALAEENGVENGNGDDASSDSDDTTEEERAKKLLEKARTGHGEEEDAKEKKQIEDYYSTAHRIQETIVQQHSSLGGGNPNLKLKPYQIRGLEWMISLHNNNLNGILADEMGLGKTIQTVALITYLMEIKQNPGPYLVVVPLSTISNWELEFEKWAPHVTKVVYKGHKETRRLLDQHVRRGQFNVLLTTYDYVLKEKALLGKINWKYLIVDEGHRLKNNNSKLTLMLNTFFRAQHRLLLTGTPLQNKLPELWALLNFLLPSIFSSCGSFDAWFNAPFETTGEKVELSQEESMLVIRRLHKVLRPFLLRRLKKEVASELPDKTEKVLRCGMSALQKILYKHMQKGMLIDTRAQQGGRALNNTMMHLRKLVNHPFLFPPVETTCRLAWDIGDVAGDEMYRSSGKFELLDRILPKLKATGHRILMFCQMTECMNILADYFAYKEWNYLRLEGDTKQDERGELIRIFNAPDSEHWLFMLSTKAGGLGLNLQTADTVIIFDSDWNPHQDMQAQDRAHRIGQTKEVRVLRLITANSIEERILAAARYKLNIDEKVIQAGKFDQKSTEAERRSMLERIICAEKDDNDEEDIPDDDALNRLIARSAEEMDIFHKMDIERRREEASHEHRKARLMEESEIPEDIIKASDAFAEKEEKEKDKESNGNEFLGSRKRKQVDYSADAMSEEKWLESMFDDEEGEEDEQTRTSSHSSERGEKRRGGESSAKKKKKNKSSDYE